MYFWSNEGDDEASQPLSLIVKEWRYVGVDFYQSASPYCCVDVVRMMLLLWMVSLLLFVVLLVGLFVA